MRSDTMLIPLRYENYLSKIILYMLFLFIPIDMLNGFMLTNGYPSVSLVFKAIVIFSILVLLTLQKENTYVSFILSALMIFTLVHLIMLGNIKESVTGLDWMIKFIGITAYFMFFRQLLFTGRSESLFLFVKLSFIFLVINFTIALLGFGYPMYSGDIGSKGFIFAGNEVGAAVIISGSLALMYMLEHKKYMKFSIISIAMLIIAALLTSKVSILGSLLIILTFPFISSIKQLTDFKLPKKSFIFSSTILIVVPILFIGVLYYALFVSNLIERLYYHLDKIDLLTLIFSHRNIWAVEAWDAFLNQYTIFEQLFGSSKVWYVYIAGEKSVEIDPIDFLMSYGIFGVSLVTAFFIFVLTQLFKHKKNNPYFPYLLFTYLLLFGLSLTSGHIINSGIAGASIGALFALSTYQVEKRVRSNSSKDTFI